MIKEFLAGALCAAIMLFMVFVIAVTFGCAGLMQMDDRWCAAHPEAGHNRCWDRK